MTTDLPALDTYDAEIVTLTGYYSLRIAEAEEAAASARQALTAAESTLAELTSERAAAVHQARERLLTATGAEIRDGGIRGKPGRPTRRVEPPALLPPTVALEPVIDAAPTDTAPETPAPAGEAPTASETFIADVSEPERSLYEQGFTAVEVAATPIDEQWRLKRANVSRADVRQTVIGTWYEPVTPAPDPTENEEAPL